MAEPTQHPVDLSALLRGELDNADAARAGDHLADCDQCRRSLAEETVGHALLLRTAATLADTGPKRTPPVDPPLPALTPPARRRVPVAVLAAAAVVLVVGVLGALLGMLRPWADDPAPPAPVAVERSAVLEPVVGDGSGQVSMSETEGAAVARMTVETRNLPEPEPGQFYYVWLLDPATNKMLPLGHVGTSGSATFQVSLELLDAYSAVDVSLEEDDGDPQHSPTSVLRASYA